MPYLSHYTRIFLIILACCSGSMLAAHLIWRRRHKMRMNWQRHRTQQECGDSHARQLTMLEEQSKQYYQMKADVDKIALCLRERYQSEIQQGFHGGRGLGDIVVGYLAREREQTRRARGKPVNSEARLPAK